MVKGSKAKDTKDNIKESKLKAKSIVGKSSALRVLDKIGNDTSKALGIATVNDKGNKKND